MITPKPYELPTQRQFMYHEEEKLKKNLKEKNVENLPKSVEKNWLLLAASLYRLATWHQFMADEENMKDR